MALQLSEDKNSNDDTEDIYPFLYKEKFNVSLFAPLVKLPGLCNQMEFYSAKNRCISIKK